MKKLLYFMNACIIVMLIFVSFSISKIQCELKELKELKMTIDYVESQIKLLTPPPEFFTLPVVRRP